MPSLASENSPLVLVTGANGYAASHIIHTLLENGYRVRGTVRSDTSSKLVKGHFSSFGDALDVILVPDITVEGAFDAALEGADAVMHVASPLSFSYATPDAAIRPAVYGTLNILQSAKSSLTIKRIVVCSSEVSMHPPAANVSTPTLYSETDWNQFSPREVEEKGKDADMFNVYFASKTLADRATWDFWEENKACVGWDVVSLHPTTILGPVLYDVKTPQDLNASSSMLWMVLNGQIPADMQWNWIDVRDVAHMHLLALQTPEAGGQRILATSESLIFQDLLDIAHAMNPPPYPNCVKGNPGSGTASGVVHTVQLKAEKQREILGMEKTHHFMTKEEMMRDTLGRFKELGFAI